MQSIKNWRDFEWSLKNRQGNLTFKQEVWLCSEVKNGDRDKALNILIDSNINMVHSITKNYHWCNIDYDDLIRYGVEGLISAADNFNPEKGYKYNTLAGHYVLGRIRRAIEQHNRTIKVPAHVNLATTKILHLDLDSDITDEMLMPLVNKRTSLNTLKSAVLVKQTQILDLDSINTLSDENLRLNDAKIALQQLINTLRPIEITCLNLRFALDGGNPKTYKEIDAIVNADSEGLINRALLKLKNMEGIDALLDYLK